MSIDEYSDLEKASRVTIMKAYGVWWLKVRSRFFRPLIPYHPIDLSKTVKRFPLCRWFQHAVEEGQPFNSHLNFVVFDETVTYNPSKLRKNVQRKLKQAARHGLVSSVFSDRDKFIKEAYPVFLSFYERTHYDYPVSRASKRKFNAWANALFASPKTMVLGAYHKESLVAVEISCLVDDILCLKESISSEVGLKMNAPDFLLDIQRSWAAVRPDIRLICCGLFGRNEGINRFKLHRGARVVALPAFLHINPILLRAFKCLRRSVYDRLVGMEQKQLKGKMKSIRV